METLWFCLIAAMLAAYVVFDGFDLGAGILHLALARTDDERRLVLRSIGPVWDGNEVWLIAAGASLLLAFPPLYASAFSGFYLPLMIVLWLLMLRGIAIELRNHIDSPVWRPLWDVTFGLSSLLLVLFFGVALGNVVRGVPLDPHGRFFVPLWTNLRPGGPTPACSTPTPCSSGSPRSRRSRSTARCGSRSRPEASSRRARGARWTSSGGGWPPSRWC